MNSSPRRRHLSRKLACSAAALAVSIFCSGCAFIDFPHQIPADRTVHGTTATQTRLVVPQTYTFNKYVIPAGIYLPQHEQWDRIFYKAPTDITGRIGMFAMPTVMPGGISVKGVTGSEPKLKFSTIEETYEVPIPSDFVFHIEKSR